jgi:hypothetical protein
MAFVLPEADPPAGLEHRVVDDVAQASGRRVPVQIHRRLRTQVRRLASVTLVAALLAVLSVGWGFAERRHARDVATVSRVSAETVVRRFERLIDSLGQSPVEAPLRPTAGRQGTGTATIVSVPRHDDQILVTVYLVRDNAGPYTVRLETRSGQIFDGFQLQRTTNGTLVFSDSSGHDLSKIEFVSILDRQARPVMTGKVRPLAATPGP